MKTIELIPIVTPRKFPIKLIRLLLNIHDVPGSILTLRLTTLTIVYLSLARKIKP
jgi:hypothetical protein